MDGSSRNFWNSFAETFSFEIKTLKEERNGWKLG